MPEFSEFFPALYWSFEGRDIRLTTYAERGLSMEELTTVAFKRARDMQLSPVYMRIFSGSFLRHDNDNEIGIAWPRAKPADAITILES